MKARLNWAKDTAKQREVNEGTALFNADENQVSFSRVSHRIFENVGTLSPVVLCVLISINVTSGTAASGCPSQAQGSVLKNFSSPPCR